MRFDVLIASIGTVMILAGATAAQDMPSGLALDEGDAPTSTSSPFTGTMTQSDEFAFRRWFDNARMMNRRADASDKTDAAAVAEKMALACTPADAALVGIQRDSDSRVTGRIYEVACSNGVGYLLVTQPRAGNFALSCFSIDAARSEAKDKAAAIACTLPANADVKAMAAHVARLAAGTDCDPREVRWIGEGTKSKMEFTEMACTSGKGYVLGTALPGAQSPTVVMSCAEAAPRGIPCSLTDAAAPVVTLQTFKDALIQHGVDCDAGQIRVVGKETASNRHVVEFQCTQQHRDIVAFIPLNDGTKPFETLDCAVAVSRGIACKLGAPN